MASCTFEGLEDVDTYGVWLHNVSSVALSGSGFSNYPNSKSEAVRITNGDLVTINSGSINGFQHGIYIEQTSNVVVNGTYIDNCESGIITPEDWFDDNVIDLTLQKARIQNCDIGIEVR